jgi:hypothetical protein
MLTYADEARGRCADTMKDRFMPAPDSLLAQAQQEISGGSHAELDVRQQTLGGIATVAGTATGLTHLHKARNICPLIEP